jgi:predicted naringenin-chalcone synthase
MSVLTGFRVTRPRHVIAQRASLRWLAEVHAQAEATAHALTDAERDAFEARLERLLERCACRPDKIAWRGISFPDGISTDWDGHALYDVGREPHGRTTSERMKVFGELVDAYFAEAITEEPAHLVHVTCTGYASPSAPQRLVARRRWSTAITHAYHMGCYAAVPAVRLATALGRADIVHTELCSLHLDPLDHSVEQLVVQSLFADGYIRYAAVPDGPGLRVLATHERVLPDSADAMRWLLSEHGMRMTLARDIPERIAGELRGFVGELFARGGCDLAALRDAVVAVHPGGPKIIDGVQATLELGDVQVAASRGVLHDHGNMSSATLPHIWARIDANPAIPNGTLVPSLAFGPGLTICGALLEKQC